MHLNAAGNAATGFASVGVDGSTPAALSGASAGNPNGPYWLSASKLAYQNFTSSAIVQSYDTGTTALATLHSGGANYVAAGNSIWAAQLSSSPSQVFSNVSGLAGPITGAGLGDVSELGELVLVTQYPANVGLTVYSAAGATLLSLPSVSIIGMSGTRVLALRNELLVYIDASLGFRMANVIGGSFAYRPRKNETIHETIPVVSASGKQYVLEVSDRITFRQADQGKGWQLKPLGTITFNPDVVEVSAGVMRIGWCSNAGESPDSLNLLDLTLATGATRDGVVVAGSIQWSMGPTLTLTDLPVGALQGSDSGDSVNLPHQSQPISDTKTGQITEPWRRALNQSASVITRTTQTVQAAVVPAAPSVGFGSIVPGGLTPVNATQPNDTLNLTSTGGSIVFTDNPATKTVNLEAQNNLAVTFAAIATVG